MPGYRRRDSVATAGSTTAAFTSLGATAGDARGRGVAGNLDVNGDAFSDLVIGESGRGDGFAYVHLGGGGDGLEYIPRNWRWTADTVVSLMGKSDEDDRFRIRSRGRTARGRGLVAMDHQIAPTGSDLSSGSLLLGGYFDTGTTNSSGAGINFTRSMTGLASEAPYKRRMRFRDGFIGRRASVVGSAGREPEALRALGGSQCFEHHVGS